MDAKDILAGNGHIENDLETLPEQVATALMTWRIATLDREKVEALLYAHFKAEEDRTVVEVKSMINASEKRYEAVLNEIKAEADYTRLLERLLAAKKIASLRTAY